MIKHMNQLISKVLTKGNIWQFNTLLKAVIQRTYVFPNTIIPYFILRIIILFVRPKYFLNRLKELTAEKQPLFTNLNI